MVVAAAGALLAFSPSAQAAYPCLSGDPNEFIVGNATSTFVAVDLNVNEGGFYGASVCAAAGGGEADQVTFGVGAHDPHGATRTGYVVAGEQCGTTVIPGAPTQQGCRYLFYPTGAEVGVPGTAVDLPLDGNGKSGAGVTSGVGTCVYINNPAPVCQGAGTPVAAAFVAEGDLPSAQTAPAGAGCLGVNATCLVPVGVRVYVGQDNSNNTVSGGVAGMPVSHNLNPACVPVNTVC